MNDDIDAFERQIDLYLKKDVPEAASKIIRGMALQALRGLVMKTPVDTGRARGNWVVSIGAAVTTDSENTDTSGEETINAGTSKLAPLEKDPFALVLIQNNLPYIAELERGHSTQAPNGMLVTTIAEIEGQFQ